MIDSTIAMFWHTARHGFHEFVHDASLTIARALGVDVHDDLPLWFHHALDLTLIIGPSLFALYLAVLLFGGFKRWFGRQRERSKSDTKSAQIGSNPSVYSLIFKYSRTGQLRLVAMGILAMPLLYATLELPKVIVNGAISSGHFPIRFAGMSFDQVEYLLALSALFLLLVGANSGLKYLINIRKGYLGERMLRRLRLTLFKRWHRHVRGPERNEVVPMVTQEVEPIGGFAAEFTAVPVVQGGTFLTILFFMFMQDPLLGAAAITLLPLQLWIIPKLQKRVNRLVRVRVAEIRSLGGDVAKASYQPAASDWRLVSKRCRTVEHNRRQIHRAKFLLKSVNNFLTALTPFFFYAIGGYLVISGSLTLGALIAVLAAHKDFSAPFKELLNYYQQSQDVRVRYEELMRYLYPDRRSSVVKVQSSEWQVASPDGGLFAAQARSPVAS